eukprot:PRCOL_00002352-RA
MFWLGTFAFTALSGVSLAVTRFIGAGGGVQKLRLNYLIVASAWFCMWLMWAIIYLAQINPLISPDRDL